MGFAILTVFLLAVGSTLIPQAVSLNLQRSSPTEHRRTVRQTDSTCPNGFIENQGNCYFFSSHQEHPTPKENWEGAKKKCEERGRTLGKKVHLAELCYPKSMKSDKWLMKEISAKGEHVWLGAKDQTQKDNWIWDVSKQTLPLNDPFWGFKQPKNAKGVEAHCLGTSYYKDDTYRRQILIDIECDEQLHYVCQEF